MINKLIQHQSQLVNLVVLLLGVVMALIAVILGFKQSVPESAQTILFGIGCSLIATSISTWITSAYIISRSEAEELFNVWQLKNIFHTKSSMEL